MRGQGHFRFAKGSSIRKSSSLWETFEGAPRPRPGAMEAMDPVASAPGLKKKFIVKNTNNKTGKL